MHADDRPSERSEPRLRVGHATQAAIVFGLLVGRTPSLRGGTFNFLDGQIEVERFGADAVTIDDKSGLEPAVLARLRSDLRLMIAARNGSLTFGTHDRTMMVELIAIDPELVAVIVDVPQFGLPDTDVATIQMSELPALIEQIDNIEATFGPLVGRCDACGMTASRYIPGYDAG